MTLKHSWMILTGRTPMMVIAEGELLGRSSEPGLPNKEVKGLRLWEGERVTGEESRGP